LPKAARLIGSAKEFEELLGPAVVDGIATSVGKGLLNLDGRNLQKGTCRVVVHQQRFDAGPQWAVVPASTGEECRLVGRIVEVDRSKKDAFFVHGRARGLSRRVRIPAMRKRRAEPLTQNRKNRRWGGDSVVVRPLAGDLAVEPGAGVNPIPLGS
jgi:hypothetical protein